MMTTTTPLLAADAYLLASLPGKVGVPLLTQALLDLAVRGAGPAGAPDGESAPALRAARARIGNFEARGNDAHKLLTDKAARAGLTLPPRPGSSEGHAAWAEAVRAAAREAAGHDAGGALAVELGAAAGELHLALGAGEYLTSLRAALPGREDLRAQAVALAARLTEASRRLATALASPGVPAAVARAAGKLPALLAQVPDVASATTPDAHRQLVDWATQVGAAVGEILPALRLPAASVATAAPSAEESELLARICASPGDNALRRRYAELAAARHDPHAELISAQLASFELRKQGEARVEDDAHGTRASALIKAHPAWTADVERLGVRSVHFYRGFIGFVTLDADAFLRNADALFATAPIEHVHLLGAAPHLAALAATPHLARLRSLVLVDSGLTDGDLAALLASPHLGGLRYLALTGNRLTNAGVEAIAAAPGLKGLKFLGVMQNPCDPPIDKIFFDENVWAWGATEFGQALDARHGPLAWLHPDEKHWPPDPDEL